MEQNPHLLHLILGVPELYKNMAFALAARIKNLEDVSPFRLRG